VPATIEAAALLVNGCSLGDLPQHLPQILLRWLLLTLPVVALGSLSADYGKFAFLLVAVLAIWFGVYFVSELYSWLEGYTRYRLRMARSILWLVLTLAVAMAVLVHQFLTRRRARSALLGIAGLAVISVSTSLWTKPVALTQLKPVQDPRFDAIEASVKVAQPRGQRPSGSGYGGPGAGLEISGVPQGYVVRPLAVGRPLSSRYPLSGRDHVRNRSTETTFAVESLLVLLC
jgi:hypothetical protein